MKQLLLILFLSTWLIEAETQNKGTKNTRPLHEFKTAYSEASTASAVWMPYYAIYCYASFVQRPTNINSGKTWISRPHNLTMNNKDNLENISAVFAKRNSTVNKIQNSVISSLIGGLLGGIAHGVYTQFTGSPFSFENNSKAMRLGSSIGLGLVATYHGSMFAMNKQAQKIIVQYDDVEE